MNFDVQQGSDEWRAVRAGYVTASRVKDVLRNPRRGQSDSVSRKAYMAQIVAERLTGKPQEKQFESYDTRRGQELEGQARAEYERQSDDMVLTAGFVEHPKLKLVGCSPDAIVGKKGMSQIKAPRMHVHMDYILAGVIPSEYRSQMLLELACHPEREWNDFCSYCPELPDHLQLFIVRLYRDPAEIEKIEEAIVKFNAEVDELIQKLPKRSGQTALEAQLEESLKITNADIEESEVAGVERF